MTPPSPMAALLGQRPKHLPPPPLPLPLHNLLQLPLHPPQLPRVRLPRLQGENQPLGEWMDAVCRVGVGAGGECRGGGGGEGEGGGEEAGEGL